METQYLMEGFCSPRLQLGLKHSFSGEITIDSEGVIKGNCKDLEALVKEQIISGQAATFNVAGDSGATIASIAFMKYGEKDESANLIFQLNCSLYNFNGDLSGKYAGKWDELARPHIIGKKIDLLNIPLSSLNYGNYAQILLKKR